MTPHIAIIPRYGNDFSIEVKHSYDGDWVTYFNGSCIILAAQCLNLAIKDHPNYPIWLEDWGETTCPLSEHISRTKSKQLIRR